ncbi:MAG: type IV secretion system DNA-binding domain-containing protein [Candidatus Magnetomorum sp.]|nr:type IV secretion system DNA-binding domain-containing protein [Candidatus Magnetomorum sp.]
MEKFTYRGKSYEGFDTLIDPVKKSFKLQARVFIALLILQTALFIVVTWYSYDEYTIRASTQWLLCKGICSFFPYTPVYFMEPDRTMITISAQEIVYNSQLSTFAKFYLLQMLKTFGYCSVLYICYPFFLVWARKRSRKLSNKRYLSGANLLTSDQFKKIVRKKKDKTSIPCGKIQMPTSVESKHCLMLGVSDSARSTFVCQLIHHLKKRNDKTIIYDSGGQYLSRFYNPETDLIFNPVDKRTVGWSLINEIDSRMDTDAITSCLLSDVNNMEMKEIAKSVFSSIFSACMYRKKIQNADIYRILSGDFPSISKELEDIEEAKEGFRHISEPSSRHAMSVFSTVTQYAKCFEFMTYNDGQFRMKHWLRQPGGMIFVSSDLNAHDKLMPVLTLFLDLLCQRLLSSPEKLSHPVFYILDDFVSLKKKNYLLRMLLASASKGGRVFLGCQDFEQIDQLYTRDTRQMIVNNCGNHLFFRVTNPLSARICSEMIGETEFIESGKTLTGTSHQMQKKREPLIFSTDIMNMPVNQAVVRFSGYDSLMTSFSDNPFKPITVPLMRK